MRAVLPNCAHWLIIGAVALATAARAVEPAPLCRPDAAHALVGYALPPLDEVSRITGANHFRWTQPGIVLSNDFDVSRVTIEVDPHTSKVTRAWCG